MPVTVDVDVGVDVVLHRAGRAAVWGAGNAEAACAVLPARPDAPGRARQLLRDWAGGWLTGRPLAALVLVGNELVINAVQHGQGEVTLALSGLPGQVLLCVHDDGRGATTLREYTSSPVRRRGLALVAELSARWGVCGPDCGTTAWAVIRG